jgi:hypothetical protein
MLTEKIDFKGNVFVEKLHELEYYEQVSQVGTDAGTITLQRAHSLVMTTDGTNAVSYRMAKNPDYAGIAQVVKNELEGALVYGGTLKTTVLAAGMNNGTAVDVNTTLAGTREIATLDTAGSSVGTTGTLTVAFDAMSGTQQTWPVIVTASNTAEEVCANILSTIGTSLSMVSGESTYYYTVYQGTGGDTGKLYVRAVQAAANDTNLGLDIDDPTEGATGFGDHLSTITIQGVAVDTLEQAATKIATALDNDATVGSFFDPTADGSTVVLTAKAPATNDAAMLFSFENTSSSGIGETNSEITTAGIAPNDGVWFTVPTTAPVSIQSPAFVASPFTQLFTKADADCELKIQYWGEPGGTPEVNPIPVE